MEEDPEISPPPEKKVPKSRRGTVKFAEPAKDPEPEPTPQPQQHPPEEAEEEEAPEPPQEDYSSSESEDEQDSEIAVEQPAQSTEAPAEPSLRNSQLKTVSVSKRDLKREKRSYTAMWNNFFNVCSLDCNTD